MPVFGPYDQEGLDAQYNLRARHPEHAAHFDRWSRLSADVRGRLRSTLDLQYGEAATQSLDLFHARLDPGSNPVLAFIHGGYWQAMDKSDFSFVAPPFVEAGIAVAVINYTLAPAATVGGIVEENRAALVWLWRNAERLGLDASRLFVCGHSAGGHLTAMMLATDWPAVDPSLPRGMAQGGCAISGLYDLEPIRLSFLNRILGLSAVEAEALSPVRLPPPPLPLLLSVGEDETEEFHRQQRELMHSWGSGSVPMEAVQMPGCNHFTIMDALADDGSPLFQGLRNLILDGSLPIPPGGG